MHDFLQDIYAKIDREIEGRVKQGTYVKDM